jgi:hypothetical protein
MEADVVAATVANAFAQGCERVLLVDNASTDATVAEATGAGAELAESYETAEYDELLRLEIMNRVVHDVSTKDGSEHIWWLWLDADEFHHAPRGRTLREHLATLDGSYRVVGARFINHFPDRKPEYEHDRHPLDYQPLCDEFPLAMCSLGHRKHPLLRFDRGAPVIKAEAGFHRASSEQRPLLEPTEAVYLHHFPFREEAATRRRLELLCSPSGSRTREGDIAAAGMQPRFRSLEAVYDGRWDEVENYRPAPWPSHGVDLVPWEELAGPEDAPSARWY